MDPTGILSGGSPAVTLGALLVGLGGLSVVLKNIVWWFDRNKETPPPAQTYATKLECQRRHEEYTSRMAAYEARMEQLQTVRNADRDRVIEGIDDLRAEFRSDLTTLHARVDNLPGQIVAMLRNTGALHG